MITRSNEFDLGRDRDRMKNPEDVARQERTVDTLLARFFEVRASRRFEVQVLADEVGMGKTFVALGLAYSILAHLKERRVEPDLEGCYQRVLVLTPGNQALYRKWIREVSEFKRRCVRPGAQAADLHFAPVAVERLDDLAVALRKPGRQPQVLIARMGLFGGDKLQHYDLKRRFTLGVLFRYWGVAFNHELRQRLLRGAPDGWPTRANALTDLSEDEDARLPFNEDQFLGILRSLRQEEREPLDALLEQCREMAQPYFRDRSAAFEKIERKLRDIYRLAVLCSIQKDFPLLIVDEAHNWKNGPRDGANGFADFSRHIAPHVRRALLLTATPFQLRPEEMLEILKVSDHLQPCATREKSRQRVEHLRTFRERTVQAALAGAERHSRQFSRAWTRLPARVTAAMLASAWSAPALTEARRQIQSLAEQEGAIAEQAQDLARMIGGAVAGCDPDLRQFLREGLHLFASNADLSHELGQLIIRHRRRTDHRLFLVGAEYGQPADQRGRRPDAHLLHGAPGLDVRGEAELPQYLLMRCLSEVKGGRGRSSLGQDLTGCYSTLQTSAQGRRIRRFLDESPEAGRYLDLLFDLVNERHDPRHPKLAAVVKEVVAHWQAGEKVLIFCFRINTAERLRDILSARIREELEAGKKKCLGGEGQLLSLRKRLTGRDRDLIGLGLDRLLWSLAWTGDPAVRFTQADFVLSDEELPALARLALLYDASITGDRVDRVFLNRATEHLLARRFLRQPGQDGWLQENLRRMADPAWVADPYGLGAEEGEEQAGEESAHFDERGCHTRYAARDREPARARVDALAAELQTGRQRVRARHQVPLLDSYAHAPSLWLGAQPLAMRSAAQDHPAGATLRALHRHLLHLTLANRGDTPGEPDFQTRALVFQALRRAVFRDSVLLRLLPQRSDLHESGWGELLASGFFANLPNQHESMAQRIAVFLEDLKASSGDIRDPSTARGALYEATRLRDQQFVALVKGGGGSMNDTRDRIFNGFNTPLLPEVLVCTSVGQEGIDLHRHCRHVVHYDLAWNPAVLEQRTGRTDRIGSKTLREREAGTEAARSVFLEIGVPFLAGTYDERMYEELRLRAQMFEVLTGGEFVADQAEGQDDGPEAQDRELGVSVPPLPPAMVDDLRVKLQVWEARPQG
ncbi:MAG: hypothetical protein RJA22_2869 [Verrucomicrobiota bacterium]